MNRELAALIHRLNEARPLSDADAHAIYRRHTDLMIERAMARVDALSQPSALGAFIKAERPDLAILNQPEEDFRAELSSIDNDLSRQVEIVNQGLDHWFSTGLIVPPYYAWRIAIILAKKKRMAEEAAFLTAWCRHFGHKVGGRFGALADRARKRGVDV